jgi:hypothetical protein
VYSTIVKWRALFNQGRVTCDDLPTSGRPQTSLTDANVERLRMAIQLNPRMSAKSLSEQVGISKGSSLQILHEKLRMRKLCSIWVRHELKIWHKELRVKSAHEILEVLTDLGALAPSRYAV